MTRALGLLVVLAAVWLLLSGIYDFNLLYWLGAGSVIACVVLAIRMDVVDHEGVPLDLGWRILIYWPWLFVEIVKANIDVVLRLLRPSPDISPTLIRTPPLQRTDLGKVIYANSITLTPGTISIDIDHEHGILVHALSKSGAEGVLSDDMNRRCAALENDRLHREARDA
ncbi:MAG: Na+/H+ antiporter subunit E [Minwuia sp.]|uniref:Na+/H+ antiporter subunit E n=1 Tax=Minwuia sp. TaxID=2493630 RepID=UPI003A89088A